jgi:alkanesulfonate monooxygenase SsuD/methylene tetrahydromethanopterin reductase-like flavin-dependent oxidoreductase (luciferase family)
VVHPQHDHVPIYLAAAGPRALDLAGTICDGAIFNALTSDDFLHQAIPRVRAAAVAAGRDPGALAFVLRTAVSVADTRAAERKALDRGKNLLALVSTLPGMGQLVQSTGFDIPALLRALRVTMRTMETLSAGGGFPDLRRNGDLTAARGLIPDDLIHQLGVIGPLPVVKERLRALGRLGITHIGVAPPEDARSGDSWRRLLGDLGE